MTEVTEVKPETDNLEDIIAAAYVRGAKWSEENPDSIEYRNKAARDYADYMMNADPKTRAAVRVVASHDAMKEALRDARDRIEALRDPSVNGVWNDALKRKIDAALSSVEDTQS